MDEQASPIITPNIPVDSTPILQILQWDSELQRPRTAPAAFCSITQRSPIMTASDMPFVTPSSTPNSRISDLSICATVVARSNPSSAKNSPAPDLEEGFDSHLIPGCEYQSPLSLCETKIAPSPATTLEYSTAEIEKSSWDSDDTDNEDDDQGQTGRFKNRELWPHFSRPSMYVIRKTLHNRIYGSSEDEARRKKKKKKLKKNERQIWHKAVRSSAENTQKMTHTLRDVLRIKSPPPLLPWPRD